MKEETSIIIVILILIGFVFLVFHFPEGSVSVNECGDELVDIPTAGCGCPEGKERIETEGGVTCG